MKMSKVYTQIETKISVSWDWNLEHETSMSLPKDISNNFTKTMFSLRDIIKLFRISKLLFLHNLLYLSKISTRRWASFTNQWIGKVQIEESWAIFGYIDLKSLRDWNSNFDSWFIVNSGRPLIQNTFWSISIFLKWVFWQ